MRLINVEIVPRISTRKLVWIEWKLHPSCRAALSSKLRTLCLQVTVNPSSASWQEARRSRTAPAADLDSCVRSFSSSSWSPVRRFSPSRTRSRDAWSTGHVLQRFTSFCSQGWKVQLHLNTLIRRIWVKQFFYQYTKLHTHVRVFLTTSTLKKIKSNNITVLFCRWIKVTKTKANKWIWLKDK